VPAGRERTGGGGGPPERDGGGGGWGIPNGGVLGIGDVVGAACVSGAGTAVVLDAWTSGGGVGEIPGSVVRGTCGCIGEPPGRGGAYDGRGGTAPEENGAEGCPAFGLS